MTDNWNGLADLFANLIEKYAAVLDIGNLPEPPKSFRDGNSEIVNIPKHHHNSIEKAEIV